MNILGKLYSLSEFATKTSLRQYGQQCTLWADLPGKLSAAIPSFNNLLQKDTQYLALCRYFCHKKMSLLESKQPDRTMPPL